MSVHGTVSGYTHGCRCDDCRQAWNGYHRRLRSTNPHCDVCGDEIEACEGVEGEWMHTATKRERADDGHLATPFTIPREVAS